MVINLNQTIIWSPQGNKYTMDTWNILWHREWQDNTVTREREREGERKRGGGGGGDRTETTSIMNKTKRGQKWLWTRLENDAYRSRGEVSKKVSEWKRDQKEIWS